VIVSGWREQRGSLVRDVECRDFEQALGLLEQVARAAVDYERRPDMCISEYNRVRLTISNPHHIGITPAERRLARKVDGLIDAVAHD
jgi:pterin-4a-carbinolamine dehydratase